MSVTTDQETQDFIELLYERSGRTNGLYTGLYQQWAELTLQAQRTVELDEHSLRRRDSGASWVRRVFGEVSADSRPSNTCLDG